MVPQASLFSAVYINAHINVYYTCVYILIYILMHPQLPPKYLRKTVSTNPTRKIEYSTIFTRKVTKCLLKLFSLNYVSSSELLFPFCPQYLIQ